MLECLWHAVRGGVALRVEMAVHAEVAVAVAVDVRCGSHILCS